MKTTMVYKTLNDQAEVFTGNCGVCGAAFKLGAESRFPQLQCPSCQVITHLDYSNIDLRMIVRPNRRFKLRTMGQSDVYHVRALLDDDRVVVRKYDYSLRDWEYKVFKMCQILEWYQNGRIG